MPNFIEIEESFCGRTDGRTDGHLRPTLLGRVGGVDLITMRGRSILQYLFIPLYNTDLCKSVLILNLAIRNQIISRLQTFLQVQVEVDILCNSMKFALKFRIDSLLVVYSDF